MNQTLTFLIGILVLGFVLFILYKQWASQWKGKLVNKEIAKEYDEDGYSTNKRRLIFETEDGKRKTQDVGKKEYKNAQVGDLYEKKKGSFRARRVNG